MSLTRRRFIRHMFVGATASSLSSILLSSCGWRLADVRSNAAVSSTKGGSFHVYTWTSYVSEDVFKDFQRNTGVKGVSEIMASNEEMLAAFQAGKARVFSVIYPSDYAVEIMQEKGYLQELDGARLEGLDTLLPNLSSTGILQGKRYCVPFAWGTTGLVYNSEKIPEPPTDWDYIWQNREKLTRRITMLDDVREVMGAALHSLNYSQNTADRGQIQQAYEKLQRLKPHLASFTTDAWRDSLVSGDLWIAMGYSTDATDLIKENPKIRYVVPTSGTNLWVDTMVIPVTAPNSEAAYDWINYVMEPERSAQLTQLMGYAPTTEAALDLLPSDVRSDPVKFPAPEVLRRCETMKTLTPEANELMERYWTQLKT